MPEAFGRRRAVPAAILTAVLLASIVPAVTNSATPPPDLERFLYALGKVESGGSYTARNATSGAYGKYQIIPSSWAAWAKSYLGSSTAPKTPANQEIVAHRKVTALYTWLDSWPVVAHWWLTGSSERNSGSVVVVLADVRRPGHDPDADRSRHRRHAAADPFGRLARREGHSASVRPRLRSPYRGRLVDGPLLGATRVARSKYATKSGAAAVLTFTGKGIAWIGPTGPTRGTARVYVDGKFVASVNLRRIVLPRPDAPSLSRAIPAGGRHTIKIAVSSSGRPVAIDELIVGTSPRPQAYRRPLRPSRSGRRAV